MTFKVNICFVCYVCIIKVFKYFDYDKSYLI